VEAEADAVRTEQKRLVAALADKGGTPEGIGPGTLKALLSLKDSS
jgi:hypothetical protein